MAFKDWPKIHAISPVSMIRIQGSLILLSGFVKVEGSFGLNEIIYHLRTVLS